MFHSSALISAWMFLSFKIQVQTSQEGLAWRTRQAWSHGLSPPGSCRCQQHLLHSKHRSACQAQSTEPWLGFKRFTLPWALSIEATRESIWLWFLFTFSTNGMSQLIQQIQQEMHKCTPSKTSHFAHFAPLEKWPLSLWCWSPPKWRWNRSCPWCHSSSTWIRILQASQTWKLWCRINVQKMLFLHGFSLHSDPCVFQYLYFASCFRDAFITNTWAKSLSFTRCCWASSCIGPAHVYLSDHLGPDRHHQRCDLQGVEDPTIFARSLPPRKIHTEFTLLCEVQFFSFFSSRRSLQNQRSYCCTD